MIRRINSLLRAIAVLACVVGLLPATCALIPLHATRISESLAASPRADSRNLYALCANDPVNRRDPDGRLAKGLAEGQGAYGPARGLMPPSVVQAVDVGYSFYRNYESSGNAFDAANTTFNPAVQALNSGYEAINGQGMGYNNSGQTLTTGQRVMSGGLSALNTVATVGAGLGGAGAYRGLTASGPMPPPLPTGVATSLDVPANTPVGRLGQPMNVPRGTNPDAIISERDYGGHAIDQMQGRGVPPSVVENTIRTGTTSLDLIPGRIRHYDSANNMTVITESDGTVVTVITGRR